MTGASDDRCGGLLDAERGDRGVRWESLFADLEAQFEAAEAAELFTEVSDRARRETGLLRLVDRLRPAVGHPVTVSARGARPVSGRLGAVGPDWLLVANDLDALVPLAALAWVDGLGAASAQPGREGAVSARLGLRQALRGVARDRAPIAVTLLDGAEVAGTIDRVGADWLEVALHPLGEERRRGAVRGVRTLPLAAVALVRRR